MVLRPQPQTRDEGRRLARLLGVCDRVHSCERLGEVPVDTFLLGWRDTRINWQRENLASYQLRCWKGAGSPSAICKGRQQMNGHRIVDTSTHTRSVQPGKHFVAPRYPH